MNPSVTKSGRQLQRLNNSSKRLLKLLYNYKRLFQLLNCRSKIDIIYTLQNIQYQCFAKISREIMNLIKFILFFHYATSASPTPHNMNLFSQLSLRSMAVLVARAKY